jgi:uncharacterized zinc-type alcohol dehydrogenase-like protein
MAPPETTIQCYAVKQKGGKLERWEYTPEPLKDNDIVIQTICNGLCHSDFHVFNEDWGPAKFPVVPGHEIIGKVTKKGSGVKHLNEGDIVGFGWNKAACMHCDQCITGNDNVCPKAQATMVRSHGGFAERFRGSADLAAPIPKDVRPQEAAPLLCAGITVYSPVIKYVKPGSKVAVLGLGGLGHLALQFASAVGAEVIAISRSQDKEQEARGFGATDFKSLDDIEKGSLDVILNTTPGGVKAGKLLKLLGPRGVLVYLGGGTDTFDDVIGSNLVYGEKTITGSAVGGRKAMRDMFRFAALHNIKPKVEIMPLGKVNEAVDHLMAGKARYRIVLETGDEFTKSNL